MKNSTNLPIERAESGQVTDDGRILWEGMPGTQWVVKKARIREIQERSDRANGRPNN
jgi:hypothetical protein